jgi:sulfur-oxidizing protein SoxX
MALIPLFLIAAPPPVQACDTPVTSYAIIDDHRIDAPLCGLDGDAQRGREIFAGRQGNCLACHRAPIPEQGFHGTIGPPLFDTGLHYTAAELRLRVVDSTRLNPETIMPAFHRIEGLTGVRQDRAGQPILSAQQVEDVIAYLLTLKQEPPAE